MGSSDVSQYAIYLVGGAVRDDLLGLPVVDRDWVVVGATPESMVDQGFRPIGKDFPVFLHPESNEEYALARTERKTARGYQGFQFNTSPSITLEQDLQRRDITINAMARDGDGILIDPYGGEADLDKRLIRHISDAFAEDPVRVLRVARFAARFGFDVAESTLDLMKEMVASGEVDALVPERVWAEMVKALESPAPQRFLSVLRECGALAKVLPEVDALFGVPQTKKYHPEVDTGIHTLMVMEQIALLTKNPVTRFAALVHDLGKALTPSDILPSHKGHERGGLPVIDSLCQRLRVPNQYQSLARAVAEFHLHMHKMAELRPETVLKMLEKTRSLMNDERAQQIADCCLADARGRTGFEQRDYPQAALFLRFQQAAKNVDAASIAADFEDGEQIKQALKKARVAAISKVKRSL